jgi:hypothetical protein
MNLRDGKNRGKDPKLPICGWFIEIHDSGSGKRDEKTDTE